MEALTERLDRSGALWRYFAVTYLALLVNHLNFLTAVDSSGALAWTYAAAVYLTGPLVHLLLAMEERSRRRLGPRRGRLTHERSELRQTGLLPCGFRVPDPFDVGRTVRAAGGADGSADGRLPGAAHRGGRVGRIRTR